MLSVRFRERFTAGARMGRKGDNRENAVRFYRHFYGEVANGIFCTVFVGAQNTSVHGFHGLTLLLNDRLLHIRESYNTDSLLHAAAVCTRDTHAQHSFMQYFSTVKTSIYNTRRKTFQSAVFAKCPKRAGNEQWPKTRESHNTTCGRNPFQYTSAVTAASSVS